MIVLSAVTLAAGSGAGNGLPPIGARQPGAGAEVPACDGVLFALPGDREGACQTSGVTIVEVNHDHAVALKTLTVAVRKVTPIARITIGRGSIGPLDPIANRWVAVTMEVKNASRRAATVRDGQLNLRVGAVRYPTQPEGSGAVPNSLTRANRRLASGATTTGTAVFEVPAADVGMLMSAPSALLFTGFGGDFGLSTFPGNAIGAIRLYASASR
jgi:hypothetical protein